MSAPSSDRYSMRNPFRGRLIVINNEIFKDPRNPRRKGTEKDAVRLRTTFQLLGFEVEVHDNKTCMEMLQIMAKIQDSSDDYDCVAVAILTHGGVEDKIFGVGEDDLFSLNAILEPLKGTKKGIPKLVFVQACRGTNTDEGHVVQEDHDTISNAEDKAIRVPLEADFLYHFSTSPGFYSFRNAATGSVFIQRLCDVFDENIKANDEIDVVKSLIKVNRRVAEEYQSSTNSPDYDKKKQMPSFVCMLRKELYLKKQP